MAVSNWLLLLLVWLFGSTLLGCGTDGPATGTVTGQVTYNSQPVTAATVVYEDPDQAWIEAAKLDNEGRYRLKDVRVAEYVVSIQPLQPKLPSESDGTVEEVRAKMATVKVSDAENIPRAVRSTQTSHLRAQVTEGEQEINFELSDATR